MCPVQLNEQPLSLFWTVFTTSSNQWGHVTRNKWSIWKKNWVKTLRIKSKGKTRLFSNGVTQKLEDQNSSNISLWNVALYVVFSRYWSYRQPFFPSPITTHMLTRSPVFMQKPKIGLMNRFLKNSQISFIAGFSYWANVTFVHKYVEYISFILTKNKCIFFTQKKTESYT